MRSHNLALAVMCHPNRRREAARVAEALDAHAEVCVVEDPRPWDVPSAMRTAALAWRKVAESPATHVGVIQDDVEVSPTVGHVLTHLLPDEVSALLLFTVWAGDTAQMNRLAVLANKPKSVVVAEDMYPVGCLFQQSIAAKYAEYLSAHSSTASRDGVALRSFCAASGIQPYVAAPCVLQHDANRLAPLIEVSGPKPIRRAATYHPAELQTPYAEAAFTLESFPQLEKDSCLSYVASTRNDAVMPLWSHYENHGVDSRLLMATFRKTIGAQYNSLPVAERVLFNTWLCAVAMSNSIQADTDYRRARVAIETLLPGALHRILGVKQLGDLDRFVDPLIDVILGPPDWASLGWQAHRLHNDA